MLFGHFRPCVITCQITASCIVLLRLTVFIISHSIVTCSCWKLVECLISIYELLWVHWSHNNLFLPCQWGLRCERWTFDMLQGSWFSYSLRTALSRCGSCTWPVRSEMSYRCEVSLWKVMDSAFGFSSSKRSFRWTCEQHRHLCTDYSNLLNPRCRTWTYQPIHLYSWRSDPCSVTSTYMHFGSFRAARV